MKWNAQFHQGVSIKICWNMILFSIKGSIYVIIFSIFWLKPGCGTIKPKFRDDFDPTVSKTIDIRRQPWLVSIGELIFPEIWRHECTGSIITSKHILTSAACVMPIKLDEDLQLR